MKSTLNKALLTASVLTLVMASAPAMANPSVLCSVRANYDAASGDANYKPGVDAQGRAVAPADLNAQKITLPTSIRIPLTVDLAQRMNDVLPDGAKLDAELGVIDVDQDGKVLFNGRDMTAATTAMCDTLERQKAAALKTVDAPKAKTSQKQKPAPVQKKEAVEDHIQKIEAAPVTPVEPQVLQDITPPQAAPVEAVQEESETVILDVEEVVTEPSSLPAPETLLNPPETTPRYPGDTLDQVAPPPADTLLAPENDAILSPAQSPLESGMTPRPPMDPLASEPDLPDPVLPAPAPMVNGGGNDGMLSGGAQ